MNIYSLKFYFSDTTNVPHKGLFTFICITKLKEMLPIFIFQQ